MGEALAVAKVCVLTPHIHLDRPFDYSIPDRLDAEAIPGCRVRVRFRGRRMDGFLLSRERESSHSGPLAPLERVNGPPVATPEILSLARAVADRYVGTLAEVLRDAVPPRHVGVEQSLLKGRDSGLSSSNALEPVEPMLGFPWADYQDGADLRSRMGSSAGAVRVALTVATGHDPLLAITELVESASVGGSCLVVTGDGRMASAIETSIAARLGCDRVGKLTAETGPAERYRAYLRVTQGSTDIVVGTRSAIFAPMVEPVLIVVWDDGDDSLVEPRHPGWHVREVAALRARQQGCGLVVAGYARTIAVARMVAMRFLESVEPSRSVARRARPDVILEGAGPEDNAAAVSKARIPSIAFRAIREGLASGPVLVQVARVGYVPSFACAKCGDRPRCRACGGPLQLDAGGSPHCTWCGALSGGFECASCHGRELRALARGSGRTADELGRAFPGVRVIVSDSTNGIRHMVSRSPGIVVATVGAEPEAEGGYAAAVLLDGDRMMARPDIAAEEETLRRWLTALALVRCRDVGGKAVIVADPTARAAQALVKADPVGWSERELVERERAHLPPAAVVAAISGEASSTDDLLDRLPERFSRAALGPAPAVPARGREQENWVRWLVVVPRSAQAELAGELRAALVEMSVGGHGVRLPRVRMDPTSIG